MAKTLKQEVDSQVRKLKPAMLRRAIEKRQAANEKLKQYRRANERKK